VQVTRFHPEPRDGEDWADVSIPLYVIHKVVSDRLGTGHLEASVLQKSSLIGLLDDFLFCCDIRYRRGMIDIITTLYSETCL
jgi:hypothetical protein